MTLNSIHWLWLFIFACFSSLLYSCANQVAPTGGPKDTKPPKVLHCLPENRSTSFTSKTITLSFNKFVQIKDADNQVFISPALDKKLGFKIKGKSIVVTLKSPLRTNTTYTINFGNSITDITEGNKLENYSYVFSTGTYLDSMGISGHVHYAFNNSTEKGILVMVYDTLTDSIVRHSRPLYFTRTDSAGRFQLSNLKGGRYKLLALKDMNFNYKYDLPNEAVAFSDTTINIKDSLGKYELALFTALPTKQQLLYSSSHDYGNVKLAFAASADSTSITPIDTGSADSIYYKEYNMGKDTVVAWLNDVHSNTIKFICADRNFKDTTNVSMKTVDSMRQARVRFNAELLPGVKGKNYTLAYNSPIVLHLNYPFKTFKSNTVIIKDDSLKKTYTATLTDSLPDKRRLTIKFHFLEDRNYHVIIPAHSVTNLFGMTNDTMKLSFHTQTSEDVGNLQIKVTVPSTTDGWFIQVFDPNGNLFAQRYLQAGQVNTVSFNTLQPGKYSARVVEDRNHNGRWDTGNYWTHLQPEKVFQYSGSINVRANWDLEAEIKIP